MEKEPLTEQKQSEVTPVVKNLSVNISGEKDKLIENISSYIQTLKFIKTKEPIFRRTAEEIIQSKEHWGCHEAGLLFVTLLRAKGHEAKYIQAFRKEDLIKYDTNKKNNNIRGHVFIRYGEENDSKIINSTSGEITNEIPNDYVLGAEGDDPWDIGLRDGLDDYISLFEKTKEEKGF